MKIGKILEFFDTLADIAVLSIFWTISSLPIITLGAATAAAYNTAIEVIRKKQKHVIKKFYNDLKVNLVQTLPFSIALVGCGLLFHLVINLLELSGDDSLLPFALYSQLIICMFFILFFAYAFTLIGRFHLTSAQILSVALKLCFCKLYKNIILIASISGTISIAVLYPPTLLLLPGILFYSLTFLLEPQFHTILNYDNDL